MVGRAIPSIASARKFNLEFLVPAHLGSMPLLENTKGRSNVTGPAVCSTENQEGLPTPYTIRVSLEVTQLFGVYL